MYTLFYMYIIYLALVGTLNDNGRRKNATTLPVQPLVDVAIKVLQHKHGIIARLVDVLQTRVRVDHFGIEFLLSEEFSIRGTRLNTCFGNLTCVTIPAGLRKQSL